MNWVEKAARFFPAVVRRRGDDYYDRDTVTIQSGGSAFVKAAVRGTRTYAVAAQVDRATRRLGCSCTCPYFKRDYSLCKHIWAVLNLAFDEAFLDSLNGMNFSVVIDDEDDDYDDELLRDEPAAPPRHAAVARLQHRAEAPAPWRRLLNSLSQQEPAHPFAAAVSPWPANREIMYRLEKLPDSSGSGRCLAVELLSRDRSKDGAPGELKPARIQLRQAALLPEAADRRILAMLQGGRQSHGYSGYAYYGEAVPGRFELPAALEELLLPMLADTGRLCFFGTESSTVFWDGGPAFEFQLAVEKISQREYLLKGSLVRESEHLPLSKIKAATDSGFVVFADRIGRLRHHGAFGLLSGLLKYQALVFGHADKDAFLEKLFAADALPPLTLPEDLQVDTLRVEPQPRLALSPAESRAYGPRLLRAAVSFDYDGQVVLPEPFKRGILDAGARRYILRDQQLEKRFCSALAELGFRRGYDYGLGRPALQIMERKINFAVQSLLEQGWHIEAEGKPYRRPGKLALSVTSGIDWFEVRGALEFDGGAAIELPALLAALRQRKAMVVLSDGSSGLLPEELLKKYGLLAALGTEQDGHMRFRACQAALLDALLAAEPEARFDERFVQARDEMLRFQGIRPAPAPEGFCGRLRPYQEEGLGWFEFLERFGFGGCLADDMGLGKTVQVLAHLQKRRMHRLESGKRSRPSLVVAPKSVVFNWLQEAGRFTPGLAVVDHTGAERAKEAALFASADIVLTSYGTLRQDILKLKDIQFEYVILDEAQAIKNASTAVAKAARLLKGRHRLALSGTPIENHLGELWSLLEFLNPGLLGTSSVFKKTGAKAAGADAATRELFARALRPFILRRTKQQVARELPPRIEQTLYCELAPAQRRKYDELRRHYRASLLKKVDAVGMGKSAIMILEALLRLRQAACHPGLIDKTKAGEPSAKLEILLEQLEEVRQEEHKALVFSQFTSMLAIVRSRLDAAGVPYAYLDGKTRDRAAAVERFQTDPDCPLFLISLKAGGLGLNLTAAEYVFLLDPWWNPAVEAQAIDRSHRIGQKRQVFAYRLIARNTVEEKVLALQQTKRDLAESIIREDNSLIRTLRREDLELLLS